MLGVWITYSLVYVFNEIRLNENMSIQNRSVFQFYPFHVASLLSWPLFTCISLLDLTTSGLSTMHGLDIAGYLLFLLAFVGTYYGSYFYLVGTLYRLYTAARTLYAGIYILHLFLDNNKYSTFYYIIGSVLLIFGIIFFWKEGSRLIAALSLDCNFNLGPSGPPPHNNNTWSIIGHGSEDRNNKLYIPGVGIIYTGNGVTPDINKIISKAKGVLTYF